MKILKQNRKAVTIELNPIELEILRGAIVKERNSRNKVWKQIDPQFPEELMYHAIMKDTSDTLKSGIYKLINKYREWGILK